MWQKIKSWFKKFGVWAVTALFGLWAIIRICANRISQQRAVNRDYCKREQEAERIHQRIDNTTRISEELIDDCSDRLEEVEQCLDAVEDTTRGLSESNVTAEQAIEELRKRFSKD